MDITQPKKEDRMDTIEPKGFEKKVDETEVFLGCGCNCGRSDYAGMYSSST